MTAAVDQLLTALADPHRRRAVDLLRARPHRAGELAQALALSAPALSRHLRVLKDAGLIAESHPPFDARVRIYAFRDGALAELQTWLAETEALWSAQLLAFKANAESGGP